MCGTDCPHEDGCLPGDPCQVLQEQISKVRELRSMSASLQAGVDERRAAWEKENEKILTSAAACRATLATEEAQLRKLALEAYRTTGSKSPAKGVGVRVVKVCKFDPVEAKKWAVSKSACLTLDGTAFKNVLLKGIFDDAPGTVEEIAQELLHETCDGNGRK